MRQFPYIFSGIFFGLYFTYYATEYFNITPVISSSLVGLIACGFFTLTNNTTLLTAIYCGSFTGMNTSFNECQLILIGIITSILFFISSKVFQGFGGRLGFIAYLSSVLSEVAILVITFFSLNKLSLFKDVHFSNIIVNYSTVIITLLASVLGFYITIMLHHKFKTTAVFASAFPSLYVGVLSVLYIPNEAYGAIVASTFFSASFLGMLAEGKVKKSHYSFLVLLHSCTLLLLNNNLGNYGGSLGAMAFLTVFIVVQFDVIINGFLRKN